MVLITHPDLKIDVSIMVEIWGVNITLGTLCVSWLYVRGFLGQNLKNCFLGLFLEILKSGSLCGICIFVCFACKSNTLFENVAYTQWTETLVISVWQASHQGKLILS